MDLVSDEIEHYRLTVEIILEFLKSEYEHYRLSDEDFNVHVCRAGGLNYPALTSMTFLVVSCD
jgi:hypothetical protein